MKNYEKENKQEFLRLLARFRNKKIGVIGDVMLDHYLHGEVDRISPEAPTPIVCVKSESFVPGGAANVAKNIVAVQGNAFLIGVIGKDASGAMLKKTLQEEGIDVRGVLTTSDRPTTQKTRIIARGHQMVRVDREGAHAISAMAQAQLLKFIRANIRKWDGIIFSDYAKGCITKKLAQAIIALANKYKKPIVGDVKPRNAFYFDGVTLLAPNRNEACAIAAKEVVREAGEAMQEKLHCNVLITQGADGMTLFEGKNRTHFPAKSHEVFDVTGAGDTVTAIVTLALASGAFLKDAAYLANCAAGIVVAKQGTATASPEELENNLKNG